jgi:hypothetical protein
MASLAERMKDASVPPNLRRGDARARCGRCRFYADGECMKHGFPVRRTEVCDDYEQKDGD